MFDPRVGKIPWRREWQPTPVFLLENLMDRGSLWGKSPWGRKESDTTEQHLELRLQTARDVCVYVHARACTKTLIHLKVGG